MSGPWSTTTGPWSTTEGPWSPGTLGVRGSFMGVTAPGASVSTAYMNAIDLLGPPSWIRAGYPEIDDSDCDGSGLVSAFLTTLTNEVNRVHAHGYNYIFSGLGVPTSVNPAAGTNGNWKYWPTDSTGDAFMAGCAVQVANVLAARAAANGMECAIEWYQEPNIRQFNPGTQTQARWAAAMKAVIDAVRAAQPDLTIIAGSVANRGGVTNTNSTDIGWTGDQFIKLAIEAQPTLGTTSAPDYWGYHPYTTNALMDQPDQYGTGQMDAFAWQLVQHNAKSPSGGHVKISVTEYGFPWELYQNIAWTEDDQLNHFIHGIAAFNQRRGLSPWSGSSFYPSSTPYLAGPELYYVDIGNNRSLLKDATTPTKAGLEFARTTLIGAAVPRADFLFNTTGLAVTFADATSGTTPTAWDWDFGDGTGTSTTQNPTYTYAAPGDYDVTLTVADAATNTDTITHTVTVTGNITPTFNYGPAAGVTPLTILAADTTPNSTAWVWDFGDGTPQKFTHDVSHVYTTAGTYTLAMFVTVGGATAATTQTIAVTASAGIPNANFISNTAGALVVAFTDLSTGVPTAWDWNFGDGTSHTTTQNTFHQYASGGTYNVTLTVTNANGSDSFTQAITVLLPVADDIVPKVEVGAPPTARTNSTTWVVDDPTRGAVDGSYVVADDYDWIDVTPDVDTQISTDRGRSQSLDRTEPATARVTLRNDNTATAGAYDGSNWGSQFFPNWNDCRIRISVDGNYIFGGEIRGAPITETQGDLVVTEIAAVDITSNLNAKVDWKPEALHTAEQRIRRLIEVGAGFSRGDLALLAPGFNQYGTNSYKGANVLEAIQDVAFSEGGLFYASAQGNAYIFKTRDMIAASGYKCLFTDQLPNGGSILQYSEVVRRDDPWDMVYNQATFKSMDDPEVVASATSTDSTSQARGLKPMPDFTTPIGGATRGETLLRMQARVNQLVDDYKDPVFGFESVTLDGARYSAAVRRQYITGLELGDVVKVERSAPGTVPSPNTMFAVIIGIQHDLSPGVLTTTFQLDRQFVAAGN